MSIIGQFIRAFNAKKAIKEAIIVKGVAVDDSALITDYPGKIAAIQAKGERLVEYLERKLLEAMASNTEYVSGSIYCIRGYEYSEHYRISISYPMKLIMSDGQEFTYDANEGWAYYAFDTTKDLENDDMLIFGSTKFRYLIRLFKAQTYEKGSSRESQYPFEFGTNVPSFLMNTADYFDCNGVTHVVNKNFLSMCWWNQYCSQLIYYKCINAQPFPSAAGGYLTNRLMVVDGYNAFNNSYGWLLLGNVGGVVYKNLPANSINMSFSNSQEFSDHASLLEILNALYDYSQGDAHTATIGYWNKSKLSDVEIAIATQKNWTIA